MGRPGDERMARPMHTRVWHPEQIKAEVRMRGKTLVQLAVENGLQESACRVALRRIHFDGEQAIASFLRLPAKELWPGRYDDDGQPRAPRVRRQATPGMGPETREKRGRSRP